MKRVRKVLYWIGLSAGTGIFLWQLLEVFKTLQSNTLPILSPGFLVFAWAALVFLIYLQMINWQQILYGLGSQLAIQDIVRGYTLSLLPRYIPGSIWGFISRGEWLHQKYATPYSIANYSSVLEVLVTLVSSIMVIGFFFITTGVTGMARKAFFFFLVFLLPVLVWLLIARLINLYQKKRGKNQSLSLTSNIPLRIWLLCILIYIGQWVVLGIAILFINGAFYAGTAGFQFFTPSNLNVSTYAFSFAWLVGFVILFVPGGIGVRELILSSLIYSNLPVSFPQAAIIAVFSRGLYFLAEMFWIVGGLFFEMILKRRKKAQYH